MIASFMAQFWGLAFTLLGVTFLIRPENVRTLFRLVQDDGMMILTGYMALLVGIAHILIFNEWSLHWTLILTLIGWVALLKGVIRLTAPKFTQKLMKSYEKSNVIGFSLTVLIVVGIYLIIKGFGL